MAKPSKKGKSVSFKVDVWYNPEKQPGVIHLASNDPDPALSDFHIGLTNNGTRRNGHPTLFRRLKKLLIAYGAPAPLIVLMLVAGTTS